MPYFYTSLFLWIDLEKNLLSEIMFKETNFLVWHSTMIGDRYLATTYHIGSYEIAALNHRYPSKSGQSLFYFHNVNVMTKRPIINMGPKDGRLTIPWFVQGTILQLVDPVAFPMDPSEMLTGFLAVISSCWQPQLKEINTGVSHLQTVAHLDWTFVGTPSERLQETHWRRMDHHQGNNSSCVTHIDHMFGYRIEETAESRC